VFDGERGWHRTALGIERLDGPVLDAQLEGERRHFGRVLARAARGELRLGLDGDGQLELSDGETLLLRVAIAGDGLPAAFAFELSGRVQVIRIESWLEDVVPRWPARYTLQADPPLVFEVSTFDPFPVVAPDAFAAPR
jgi:hypothetical protein